jgi:uncharacterized protein YjbI with pentapeptide repeats
VAARTLTLAALAALALGAGLVSAGGTVGEAAVSCPVVNSSTGAVSPAPAPDVDWLGCNLTGANLTGADLSGADLESTNLVNATLKNGNLSSANLSGASMSNTDFTGATLAGVSSGWISTLLGGPVTLPTDWSLIDGYLMGPDADLAGAGFLMMDTPIGAADLQGANLTGADFDGNVLDGTNLADANLTGADLAGSTLESVNVSGAQFAGADFFQLRMYTYSLDGITAVSGQAASLPKDWSQAGNYFFGPTVNAYDAELANLNLTGADLWAADLENADLTGTNLNGADLYGAGFTTVVGGSDIICPDGTNSNADGDSCMNHLTSVPVAFPTIVGANVTFGAPDWYMAEGQLVTWNWTDLTGGLNDGACPATSTSSGEGAAVKVTATCRNAEGGVGTQTVTLKIDPTQPKVAVTGVRNGRVYPLGRVPKAGCASTDKLSGISKQAAVKITPAVTAGPGNFKATCNGAVTGVGMRQSRPVAVSYTVAYGLYGFVAPKAKAAISRTKRTLRAEFRLAGNNGKPLAGKIAAALARGGLIEATLAGPGIHPVVARCSWKSAGGYFRCAIPVPAHVRIGRVVYTVAASEKIGKLTVTAPAVGRSADPVRIRFR